MPNSDVLQGWKEIAAYVSRDVSTVKRWEKQRGLPVRRVPGGGRANVFAHASELTRWLLSAGPDVQSDEAESAPSSPALSSLSAPSTAPELSRQGRSSAHKTYWFAFAAAIGLLSVTFAVIAHPFHTASAVPSAGEAASLLRHKSAAPGVEDLYLRGVYAYERRTPDSLSSAEGYFQQTAAKDSHYAPAHAGLAITYNLMREFGTMPSEEAYAKSRIEAEKAIALDPGQSEAHAALGFVEFFQDWKAADAEREFRAAIQLDPNSALARHWYGSMLLHEGRFAEAVDQLDYAQRLVPSSTSILLTRGMALAFAGHRQQGIDLLHQIGVQDHEFGSVHLRLGTLSMLEPHDINMLLSETETWAQLNHDPTTLERYRGMEHAFRSGGEPAMWKELLKDGEAGHVTDPTGDMAMAQAELGNKDQAFAILQEHARDHAPELIGINLRPELRSLHSDPRYNAVLESMGLPPLKEQ